LVSSAGARLKIVLRGLAFVDKSFFRVFCTLCGLDIAQEFVVFMQRNILRDG